MKTYYFIFGSYHSHFADCYHKISAMTMMEARTIMNSRFGHTWKFQYDDPIVAGIEQKKEILWSPETQAQFLS